MSVCGALVGVEKYTCNLYTVKHVSYSYCAILYVLFSIELQLLCYKYCSLCYS